MIEYYLGIDPGCSGAYAVVSSSKQVKVASPYPGSPGLLLSELRSWNIRAAVIEHVHSFPGAGVVGTFKFGENYGIWQGIVSALNIPYTLITPMKWQSKILDSVKVSKPPNNETDLKAWKRKESEWKRIRKTISVNFVNRKFPGLNLKKSRHNEADAICIALYCRLMELKT